jgi:NAD(P)-dependent dehydrogenase (short-subunit alcohol dehydrogenase family)
VGEIDLRGRTAVVTGASRGIGAAIARYAAERGVRLGLCARSAPALPESETVVSLRADVTDEAAMTRFAACVEERFGAIDLWINNAGVLGPIAPVRDVTPDAFRRHLEVNLTGVFIATRLYIAHRRRHGGGGVLINVSSGAASKPYQGWGPYCAGKAGVERLTEVVALEERASGLRAHAIAPGVVDTDMQAEIRACPPERFPEVARFVEMKRDDSFNTGRYVARELLAIAFDPARRSDEVALRLADEVALRLADERAS